MISSLESLTGDLKRRRTLQGRYGRRIEQSWVGRRVTKMISTLKEMVREQKHVGKERQITLDILEGRRPQAGVTLSTAFVVEEEVPDQEYVLDQRQLTLDILEGRRPQAGVTLSTAFVVEEEVPDQEYVLNQRQLTLGILEGRYVVQNGKKLSRQHIQHELANFTTKRLRLEEREMVAQGERDGHAGRERWSRWEREMVVRGEREMVARGERYDLGCRREIWVVGERLWVVGERYGLSERDDLWSRAERDMTLVAQRDMTLVAPDRYDVGCAGEMTVVGYLT
ncbi:hypothetical protein BDZ89DRAFT_1239720 [Hymenopellis radicata]|nr:hypothetical protein BDZ89DRAFT_1239720 [Hymenopellis radicata]